MFYIVAHIPAIEIEIQAKESLPTLNSIKDKMLFDDLQHLSNRTHLDTVLNPFRLLSI